MSIASQTVKKGTITRKAVFVSVTNALAGEIPDILPSTPLVDFSRGFWYVNANKIKQCELLVAVEKGIVLAGGGALIQNLDKFLSIKTGMPVYIAENPLDCVVKGTGTAVSSGNASIDEVLNFRLLPSANHGLKSVVCEPAE